MGIWFKGFMVIDKELGSTVGDIHPLSLLCRCLCDLRGIWTITPETRSGLEIGNLPFEEALFFALTNLFVLQGLCLWETWKGKKA